LKIKEINVLKSNSRVRSKCQTNDQVSDGTLGNVKRGQHKYGNDIWTILLKQYVISFEECKCLALHRSLIHSETITMMQSFFFLVKTQIAYVHFDHMLMHTIAEQA